MKVNKLIILFFLIVCWSCQTVGDDEKPTEIEEPIEVEDPTSPEPCFLGGTQWKLEGIVDAETNTLKVLEPEDNCLDYYTITFNTDTTAQGQSIVISVNLNPIQLYCSFTYLNYYFWEDENHACFCKALNSVKSYACDSNELKFYFNDKRDYLLFTCVNICDVRNPLEDILWLREMVELYKSRSHPPYVNISRCTYNNGMRGFYIEPSVGGWAPSHAVLYSYEGVELADSRSSYLHLDDFCKKWDIKDISLIWRNY